MGIPEGQMKITGQVELQENIAGVDYSKNGFLLKASLYIPVKDQLKEQKALDNLLRVAVEQYYERLKTEVAKTRNDMIDSLRIELSKKYDERLLKAKEIISQRDKEIKLLKGSK